LTLNNTSSFLTWSAQLFHSTDISKQRSSEGWSLNKGFREFFSVRAKCLTLG
jgi:hypothetical protein